MDKKKAFDIEVKVNEKLKEIAEEFEVAYKKSGGTYSDSEYTFKVTFEEKFVASNEMETLRDILELSEEEFNSTFTLDGEEFKIAGFKPKATKNKVVIVNQKTNLKFVTSIETIRDTFGKN